jgi:Asp/Glu/hydantoin racemase
MAIHIRVVTPITTQGFRSPEDASQLESDGVKVDFVNIETGPASIECNYEIMLSQLGTIARVIEAAISPSPSCLRSGVRSGNSRSRRRSSSARTTAR